MNAPANMAHEPQQNRTQIGANKCMTCTSWGVMGKCTVQSGTRMFDTMVWHQIVTTAPNDTCGAYTPQAAS